MSANLTSLATFSPLYQQIKAMLLASLQAGEWQPGEVIPSEFELAARYEVSQGTVRKAIDELTTQNLLIRKQGKGTFVATHLEERHQFRFLRLAPDSGLPIALKNHFLSCKKMKASALMARALKIKTGENLIEIERVQTFAGKAIVFEQIWLPSSRFKGLDLATLLTWDGPLYALYESAFTTHMVRATEKIKAVSSDSICAQRLNTSLGAPILLVERVSYTYGNKPVEIRLARYDTSSQHYENTLS
ncbi:MAG: GntR family transcriptional regulator [Polynucleobacter sp.]